MTTASGAGFLLRDLFRKDISEPTLAYAQTSMGKCVLLLLFLPCFMLIAQSLPGIGAATASSMPLFASVIALCVFFPALRWKILTVAALAKFAFDPFWFYSSAPADLFAQECIAVDYAFIHRLGLGLGALYFLMVVGLLFLRQRYGHWRICKRPILFLLLFVLAQILVASVLPLTGLWWVGMWLFVLMNANYIWFLGYALLDKGKHGVLRPLALFSPIWSLSRTPIGKNLSYMEKTVPQDAQAQARTHISAVKLVMQCGGYLLLFFILTHVIEQRFHIPPYERAFLHNALGSPYPVWVSWVSLVVSFFTILLTHLAGLNSFVAAARMAGFQLLRNTYKPLSSRTIAEFWNRYLYYFKELLADFFFYPTFLRHLKRYPKLRLAFATFMAAGIGNLLYHMLRMLIIAPKMGVGAWIEQSQTYVFYTLLLSAGIIVSQLRGAPKANLSRLQQCKATACVIAFFCFVHIFDDMNFRHSLPDAFGFLFHLFGLRELVYGH